MFDAAAVDNKQNINLMFKTYLTHVNIYILTLQKLETAVLTNASQKQKNKKK